MRRTGLIQLSNSHAQGKPFHCRVLFSFLYGRDLQWCLVYRFVAETKPNELCTPKTRGRMPLCPAGRRSLPALLPPGRGCKRKHTCRATDTDLRLSRASVWLLVSAFSSTRGARDEGLAAVCCAHSAWTEDSPWLQGAPQLRPIPAQQTNPTSEQ